MGNAKAKPTLSSRPVTGEPSSGMTPDWAVTSNDLHELDLTESARPGFRTIYVAFLDPDGAQREASASLGDRPTGPDLVVRLTQPTLRADAEQLAGNSSPDSAAEAPGASQHSRRVRRSGIAPGKYCRR
jgi:hypothetical protein